MADRIDLKQAEFEDLTRFIDSLGAKPYRARQVGKWIFKRGVADFEQMTDISKSFRQTLADTATVTQIQTESALVSADGSVKFLFALEDGLKVESVLIPEESRVTLCVSTQAGCKLSCKFCMTARGGFSRNLTAAEIVDQIIQAGKHDPDRRISNVVLMGMGEPLDNFDNVIKALKIMSDPEYAIVGVRKITLSTAGLVPEIARLGLEFPKVKLAVSVNACTDAKRSAIMPVNNKYPLAELKKAIAAFPLPQGRRVTLEYVMLAGINDSMEDAADLINFSRGLKVKINLIPFNTVPEISYGKPDQATIEKFQNHLIAQGLSVFIRQSRGDDILAACGQLCNTPPSR